MTLDRKVIQELLYQPFMDWALVERWLEIPVFAESNPACPEWQPTPVFPLDLTTEEYGVVSIKDESVNPTGTHKDRPAWEIAAAYRDFAHVLHTRKVELTGAIAALSVPRFSLITEGNEGRALAERLKQHGLPPVKVVVGLRIGPERLEALKRLHVDIYQVDLQNHQLTAEDVKEITNNVNGIDITSAVSLDPQEIFYDWLAHEIFNESPDEVYVPYGSGRLMENLLTWQKRNVRKYIADGRGDQRLRIPLDTLIGIHIFGAEPQDVDSKADKLSAHFKPFTLFKDHDVGYLIALGLTGHNSKVYKVREEYIRQAHTLFERYGVRGEASAAAGLALYMQLVDERTVNPADGKKRLVVNTGKGI